MASNDPTDTGGLFIGRRPGTGPVRLGTPLPSDRRSRRRDSIVAAFLLLVEIVLLLTLWGPQPAGWLWVGSQVDYATGDVSVGILVAFVGMIATLFFTVYLAKRVDNLWKLARRAAGHMQAAGALERIFVVTLAIAGTAFVFWFLVIEGPGPTLAPRE